MIMDKISISEDETRVLHNVQSFVLDRLLTQQSSASDHSISMGVLTDSIDNTMSPLFDQAIEDLIAQGLIHSEDGENYQITSDGINEL
jgi:hypothetical protein